MSNSARIFAYTTWVLMISLAIVVFTNNFLVYIDDPGWIGLAAILAFGLIYLNFSYLVTKRYIRKILSETSQHYLLALLIFLPPMVWIGFISDQIGQSRVVTLLVIAFACGLGAVYGYRSGKRQQREYAEQYRRQQESDS